MIVGSNLFVADLVGVFLTINFYDADIFIFFSKLCFFRDEMKFSLINISDFCLLPLLELLVIKCLIVWLVVYIVPLNSSRTSVVSWIVSWVYTLVLNVRDIVSSIHKIYVLGRGLNLSPSVHL